MAFNGGTGVVVWRRRGAMAFDSLKWGIEGFFNELMHVLERIAKDLMFFMLISFGAPC